MPSSKASTNSKRHRPPVSSRTVAALFADAPAKIRKPRVSKHPWPITDGQVHPVTIIRPAR